MRPDTERAITRTSHAPCPHDRLAIRNKTLWCTRCDRDVTAVVRERAASDRAHGYLVHADDSWPTAGRKQ